MRSLLRSISLFIGASVSIGLVVPAAMAQTGADFFKDKAVTYIVATAPGGGYDLYGRLIAQYMQKYLPDRKSVV